jgi:FAD binding domain
MMRFLYSRYSTTAGLAVSSSSSGAFRRTARGTSGSLLKQRQLSTAAASAAAAAVTSSVATSSSSSPPPRRAGRPEEKWCHDGDTTTTTIVHSELLAVFSKGDDDDRGGECVSINPYELRQHGQDESYHTPASPDFVVYPTSIEHIQGILAIGRKYRVPIIPFGAGTSVEGHINALLGGISLGTYVLRVMNSKHTVIVHQSIQPGQHMLTTVTRLLLLSHTHNHDHHYQT